MKLSFFMGFLLVCLSGCAAKQTTVEQNLAPTREDLLQTFQPSSSWCVDGLVVNFLSAGCASIIAEQSESVTTVRCNEPQLGATDPFSNGSFIIVPRFALYEQPPLDAQLVCMDAQLGVFKGAY